MTEILIVYLLIFYFFSRRAAYPAEPESKETLEIPDEWTLTGDVEGQRFLLYDSGPGQDRLILFATDSQLRRLAVASTWYMDGTFSRAPAIFTQVCMHVVKKQRHDSFYTPPPQKNCRCPILSNQGRR